MTARFGGFYFVFFCSVAWPWVLIKASQFFKWVSFFCSTHAFCSVLGPSSMLNDSQMNSLLHMSFTCTGEDMPGVPCLASLHPSLQSIFTNNLQCVGLDMKDITLSNADMHSILQKLPRRTLVLFLTSTQSFRSITAVSFYRHFYSYKLLSWGYILHY